MATMTTIPVKSDTKAEYDRIRGGRRHNEFIQELVAVYSALSEAERYQRLAIVAKAREAALQSPTDRARQDAQQQGG